MVVSGADILRSLSLTIALLDSGQVRHRKRQVVSAATLSITRWIQIDLLGRNIVGGL